MKRIIIKPTRFVNDCSCSLCKILQKLDHFFTKVLRLIIFSKYKKVTAMNVSFSQSTYLVPTKRRVSSVTCMVIWSNIENNLTTDFFSIFFYSITRKLKIRSISKKAKKSVVKFRNSIFIVNL